MIYLCFSDGERELSRIRWYGSIEDANAEVIRRNSAIEQSGMEDAGYWYICQN